MEIGRIRFPVKDTLVLIDIFKGCSDCGGEHRPVEAKNGRTEPSEVAARLSRTPQGRSLT